MEAEGSQSTLSKGSKVSSPTAAPAEAQGGEQKARIRRSAVSRAARAGLQFPVGRIHRKLRENMAARERVGTTGAMFSAAVLEFLCAEVLELAGNNCMEEKRKRITPRDLMFAIRGDEELDTMVKAHIAGGGVIPHIHKAMLNKNWKK